MPPRLIINADDFGLTPGINRSIEELYRAGVLPSVTLMAGGPAFDDATAVAKRNPALGVGCHVVLVDGIPVSPPESIPSLIGPDRRSFRPSLAAFAAATLSGRVREKDVRTEALAQIRRLQAAGISVTHVDTHKHAHLFPSVSRPLIEAARSASVRAIRNPFEPRWSRALGHGSHARRLQLHLLSKLRAPFSANPNLRDGSVATTSGTLGISATGDLTPSVLREILEHLPPGTWELVCHPGYGGSDLDLVGTRLRKQRQIEHGALLEVLPPVLLQPGAPSLIHYGELSADTRSIRSLSEQHRPKRERPA